MFSVSVSLSLSLSLSLSCALALSFSLSRVLCFSLSPSSLITHTLTLALNPPLMARQVVLSKNMDRLLVISLDCHRLRTRQNKMDANKKYLKVFVTLILLWLVGVVSSKAAKKSKPLKNSNFVVGRIPPGKFEYSGELGLM